MFSVILSTTSGVVNWCVLEVSQVRYVYCVAGTWVYDVGSGGPKCLGPWLYIGMSMIVYAGLKH